MAEFDRQDPHKWADDVEDELAAQRVGGIRKTHLLFFTLALAIFGSLGELSFVARLVWSFVDGQQSEMIAAYPTDIPAPEGIELDVWLEMPPEARVMWLYGISPTSELYPHESVDPEVWNDMTPAQRALWGSDDPSEASTD